MGQDATNPRPTGGGYDNPTGQRTTFTLTLNGRQTTPTTAGKPQRKARQESSVEPPTRDPDMPIGKVKWWPSLIVAEVARPLIEAYHSHLLDYDLPIIYLFAKDPPKVRGQEAAGTAQKIYGLNAYLFALGQREALKKAGHEVPSFLDNPVEEKGFFVITIWYSAWRAYTPEQRMALVDHELAHCSFKESADGEILPAMRGHDVEEFYEIAERWGAWDAGLQKLFEKLRSEHRRKIA